MRRSLFARLAALSVTVAVVAVGATAWLTTRSTSDRLVGEFTRSLEADAFVYNQLLDHATTHPDWNAVGPLVANLADRTGRRIVLVDAADVVLADSARTADGESPSLPAVPAALIDPFAPLEGVTVEDDAVPTAARSGVMTSMAPPSLVIPGVEAERRARAQELADCLADGFGVSVGVDELLSRVGTGALFDPLTEEQLDTCGRLVERVLSPTTAETAVADDVRLALSQCLSGTDLPSQAQQEAVEVVSRSLPLAWYLVDPSPEGSGITVVDPLPSASGSGAPGGADGQSTQQATVDACVQQTNREVFGPYVADPALLYVETPVDDGLLATAGGNRLLGALGAVLAVVIGVTLLAGRRLVAPIRALTGAAQHMEEGHRSARVDVRGRDDVAQLGTAFNAMAESLDRTERQRRAMVSDIAHELRSPLTRLRGHLEAAQDGVLDIDDELVASLLEESMMVQRLVEDLQQLALADAGQLHVAPEPVDVADVAGQVVATHRARAGAAGIELSLAVDGLAPVQADPARLRQALGNLVTNALAYTPDGGSVEVRVRPANERDSVAVSVADTGVGIAPEHLPQLFDRFYRADPSRSRETGGSGLGLAITRTLVEAHGGTVEVESTPGEGSCFTITLPGR